jgi:hypothetical protein
MKTLLIPDFRSTPVHAVAFFPSIMSPRQKSTGQQIFYLLVGKKIITCHYVASFEFIPLRVAASRYWLGQLLTDPAVDTPLKNVAGESSGVDNNICC